jgi:hypothetical protein
MDEKEVEVEMENSRVKAEAAFIVALACKMEVDCNRREDLWLIIADLEMVMSSRSRRRAILSLINSMEQPNKHAIKQ